MSLPYLPPSKPPPPPPNPVASSCGSNMPGTNRPFGTRNRIGSVYSKSHGSVQGLCTLATMASWGVSAESSECCCLFCHGRAISHGDSEKNTSILCEICRRATIITAAVATAADDALISHNNSSTQNERKKKDRDSSSSSGRGGGVKKFYL